MSNLERKCLRHNFEWHYISDTNNFALKKNNAEQLSRLFAVNRDVIDVEDWSSQHNKKKKNGCFIELSRSKVLYDWIAYKRVAHIYEKRKLKTLIDCLFNFVSLKTFDYHQYWRRCHETTMTKFWKQMISNKNADPKKNKLRYRRKKNLFKK